MPETPNSFEQPHKFEPKMWQGRKQLACEVCGYMEVAAIHVPARQDAVHAAKPEQFFPHPDAEMDIDAAAARQDAVPAFTQVVPCSDCGSSTTEHHPNCQMWARGTNLLTTQPPQAAVGEGELKRPEWHILEEENVYLQHEADVFMDALEAKLREAIAQRDEARVLVGEIRRQINGMDRSVDIETGEDTTLEHVQYVVDQMVSGNYEVPDMAALIERIKTAEAKLAATEAQRDEARKELNCPKCEGKGCYECKQSGSQVKRLTDINAELCESHNTLLQDATSQQRRAEAAEAKLAALDVPKPESGELERLDSMVSKLSGPMFRQERRSLDAEFHGAVRKLLTRLRSLPSEPGSGVQRKAVENGVL